MNSNPEYKIMNTFIIFQSIKSKFPKGLIKNKNILTIKKLFFTGWAKYLENSYNSFKTSLKILLISNYFKRFLLNSIFFF